MIFDHSAAHDGTKSDNPTTGRTSGARPERHDSPFAVVRAFPASYFEGLAEAAPHPDDATRFRALALVADGYSGLECAERIGVSAAAVTVWARKFVDGGQDALIARYPPRPPMDFDRTEIEALAASRVEPEDGRVLTALLDIMDGKAILATSRKHDIPVGRFTDWLDEVQSEGSEGIHTPFRTAKIELRDDIDATMLRARLEETSDADMRRRLTALALIYAGRRVTNAADEAGLSVQVTRNWAKKLLEGGLSVFDTAPKLTELRSDFDAARVRSVGEGSEDPEVSRRCAAIAALYDGRPRVDVAGEMGITRASIHNWCQRFAEHGELWLLNATSVSGWAKKPADAKPVARTVEDGDVEAFARKVADGLENGGKVRITDLVAWFRDEIGVEVSRAEVFSLLGSSGYGYLNSRVVPMSVVERRARKAGGGTVVPMKESRRSAKTSKKWREGIEDAVRIAIRSGATEVAEQLAALIGAEVPELALAA